MSLMSLISVVVFLCGLAMLFLGGARKGNRPWVAVMVGVYLLLGITYVTVDELSGNGINEAVLYHIYAEMSGAGLSEFTGFIAKVLAVLLMGAWFTFWLARRARVSDNAIGARCFAVALVVALFFHPFNRDIYSLLESFQLSDSVQDEFDRYYAEPVSKAPEGSALNLIYIYAESLERTYFDEQVFPELITELKRWEGKATSFTDIHSAWGTDWTIAGMTASQCGIPLMTPGPGGNEMNGYGRFLPKARCVGDVLSSMGFHLTFMGGADLNFAGKGNFYRSHGFKEVLGRAELFNEGKNANYMSGWGLYDDTLLDLVFEKAQSLSKLGPPFGLFALTLDTHHPHGHLSQACTDVRYADGSNDMLNAIKCADRLLARFLDKLADTELAKNTLVVVASDHLAMPNGASNLLASTSRRNLLMILDPRRPEGRVITKPGTTLDFAPIVLSRLGISADEFGLGRNLERGSSLVNQVADFSDRLKQWAPSLRTFWNLPNVAAMKPSPDVQGKVRMGGVPVAYPVFLTLDDHFNVTSMLFGELHLQVSQADQAKAHLAVADCNVIQLVTQGQKPLSDSGLCYMLRRPGQKEFYVLDQGQVEELWGPALLNVLLAGHEPVETGWAMARLEQDARIVSSGGLGRASGFINKEILVDFSRGLNIFGVKERQLHLIVTVDTCGQPAADLSKNFSDIFDQKKDEFEYLGVAVHDSASCYDQGVRDFFKGTAFRLAPSIAFRTPYIGLLDKQGRVRSEQLGKSGSTLSVWLQDLKARSDLGEFRSGD